MRQLETSRITDAELKRYDIARVPSEYFEWGGYRYSNARDAIAAAERATRA